MDVSPVDHELITLLTETEDTRHEVLNSLNVEVRGHLIDVNAGPPFIQTVVHASKNVNLALFVV